MNVGGTSQRKNFKCFGVCSSDTMQFKHEGSGTYLLYLDTNHQNSKSVSIPARFRLE